MALIRVDKQKGLYLVPEAVACHQICRKMTAFVT